MDKKNTMLLTVIAVATLLVAVVGATFAFFTASNTATGTTNAETTTTKVGSIAFSGGGDLHIKLLENDMTEATAGTTGKTFWGTADTSKNYVDAAEYVDSTKVVIQDGDADTVYYCEVEVKVTKGGNANLLQPGDAKVVFNLFDGASLTGAENVVSGEEIDVTSLEDTYILMYSKTGNTSATGTLLLQTAINFTNKATAQDYFAGKGYTIDITNNDVNCEIQ